MKKIVRRTVMLSAAGLLLWGLFTVIKEAVETFLLRVGPFGGEVLILPLFFVLFMLGVSMGKEQRQERHNG